MTERLGMLTLPAAATDDPIGDPMRQVLGDYLAAALNANLQTAWNVIGAGTKVVERVEVNDPADNTFHTTKLPALFVYDANKPHQFPREGDDLLFRKAFVAVLWVPPPRQQAHRATREPFFRALDAAVMSALRKARTKTYIYPGDTDPLATLRGSWIQGILKLSQPLHYEFSSEDTTLEIEIRGGPDNAQVQRAKYPAYRATIAILEQLVEADDDDISVNIAENTTTPNEDTDPAESKLQTYPAPHY